MFVFTCMLFVYIVFCVCKYSRFASLNVVFHAEFLFVVVFVCDTFLCLNVYVDVCVDVLFVCVDVLSVCVDVLFVCVNVFVCVDVFVYVFVVWMYLFVWICLFVWMYLFVCVDVFVCLCGCFVYMLSVFWHVCVYEFVSVCISVCISVCVCVWCMYMC